MYLKFLNCQQEYPKSAVQVYNSVINMVVSKWNNVSKIIFYSKSIVYCLNLFNIGFNKILPPKIVKNEPSVLHDSYSFWLIKRLNMTNS